MRPEINNASILGFAPYNYPSGVILAERWEDHQIVKFTAIIGDIEESEEWADEHVYKGIGAMADARADFLRRAGA